MKSRSEDAIRLRERLKRDEDRLWQRINHETEDLEHQLSKTLKVAGIAAAGLVTAYTIYRLMAPKPAVPKKAVKSKTMSRVGQSLLTMAISNILPLAIKQINKANQRDNEPIESARGKEE
ncbi:hypothetical protein [Reichenbachiella ulvae]|uniref:DUF3618 domain-containing protein n=1 Tax=Reichenbachiella ulvae TaxID=2980104 RepID=A0ABT3CWL0_9BACT|nr:hypothetical protein [Reichenbachiella ulvae]MCV9387909.1 hypothetical protein [Reichenbachiella ulvae]